MGSSNADHTDTSGVVGTETPRFLSDRRHSPEEQHDTLRDYVAIVLRRKWVISAVLVMALAIAALYNHIAIPIYCAVATIEVGQDAPNSIKTLGENLAHPLGQSETYATESEILKSRVIAGALVKRLDLGASPEFARAMTTGFANHAIASAKAWLGLDDHPPEGLTEKQSADALVDGVLARISVQRQRTSRLLKVSMEATDPELARQLLSAYLDIYMERNLQLRRRSVREAGEWLKQELEKTELKLVTSLTDLVKFTSEHGLVSLDTNSNHVLTFFNRATERLAQSAEQRLQLEASADSSKGPSVAVLPAGVQPVELAGLRQKLALLDARYSEMQEVYSEDYPKMVMLKKQVEVLKNKISELDNDIITSALDTAKKQEMLHQKGFERAKQEAIESNSLGVQYAVLKKDVETNEQVYNVLLQKSKEIDLNAQIVGSNLTLVDPPEKPNRPVRPKKRLILLVAGLLGVFGGVAVAFCLEHLDDKVRTIDDIEQSLNLPYLGLVPHLKRFKIPAATNGKRGVYEFLPYDLPQSRVSDAIVSVTASIQLCAPERSPKTIVVSSAVPGEGKTFMAVALATALSSHERKVLIVDADLRKPGVGEVFGEQNGTPGLTNVLSDSGTKLSQTVRRSRVPGLYYLLAGKIPSNPAGFLRSERMTKLIEHLGQAFHLVVFDTPPIVGFPDVPILAARCDAMIMVTKEGHVSLELLRHAKSIVTASNVTIMGMVINMANLRSSHYGSYRYYDHYRYYGYEKYYSSNGKRVKDGTKTRSTAT